MAQGTATFGLSERQSQVIQLLHWTDKEIAQALGISPNTVKKRVKAILKRTASTTRTEAALKYAMVSDHWAIGVNSPGGMVTGDLAAILLPRPIRGP